MTGFLSVNVRDRHEAPLMPVTKASRLLTLHAENHHPPHRVLRGVRLVMLRRSSAVMQGASG